MLTEAAISDYVLSNFDGLMPKQSWGETSFFYNPDGSRSHGTYFFTIKSNNGANDKASHLDREGIYRLNFGVTKATFLTLFDQIPARPEKGKTIAGAYDFTIPNMLTPHPIYGWMRWLAILSPQTDMFEQMTPLIQESYGLAVQKFDVHK